MTYSISPSVRNNPAVFTSLAALTFALVFSGVTGGAAQERPRTLGIGRTTAILAEQRRHAATLEKIELAISRLRADIALLNARFQEAGLNREAANAAAARQASGALAQNNASQSNSPGSGPEFDLSELRTSFDTEAVTQGPRKQFRPRLPRAGKASPTV
jgi:hypothetical protein